MTNGWYYYSMMAKQKEIDFRREADLMRLRRAARPRQAGMAIRLRSGLGNLLIRAGEAVKPPVSSPVTSNCPARSCH